MNYNERIKKFIELQNKNMKFEDIALELGIAKSTLRSFLNKYGYKINNGRYELKEDNETKQIEFSESLNKKKSTNTKQKEPKKGSNKKVVSEVKKEIDNKVKSKSKNVKKESKPKVKEIDNKNKVVKRQTLKKDRKINITQEDLDKLCEVYDWYMEVKDLKSMKSKPKTNKKDIKIENMNLTELKSTSIKVDKKTWEDFERLCSNSEFSKQEIITQALKDFMKEYKNLL